MKELYAAVDAVLAESRAEDTLRNIMFGLAIHMDVRTFESRPGYARLVRYSGTSEKTVQRGLRKLENELREIALVGSGNGRRAQTYRILVGLERRSRSSTNVTASENQSGGHQGGQKEAVRRSLHGVTAQQEQGGTTTPFPPSSEGGGDPELVAPVLFDAILRRLALDIGNGFVAKTMVEPLEQLGRRGDVLEVLAPDYCELALTRRYGRRLTSIARDVLEDQAVEVAVVTTGKLAGSGGPRR